MPELVSCVVATGNRRRFLKRLIRCFLRQSWTESELVIVDDGEEPASDLCSGIARIRYIQLPGSTPTGAKLNIGIEQARGPILQKLDDDDYYDPAFLATAIAHLPAKGRDGCLVGWDCFLVFLAGDEELRFSGHGWVAGGTFCFSRKLWEKTPFRPVPRDEDNWFLRDHDPTVIPVCAPEQYILVRHGANTWTNMRNSQPVDDFFRGLPASAKKLEDLVDPEDAAFYRSLKTPGG